MATTQYIGPRLIPTGKEPYLYDPARAYEQLMFVQDAQGGTYLSMIPVPPGAEFPETGHSNKYWLYLSAWNAQVQEYADMVEQYRAEIEGGIASIDELRAAIETLEQTFTEALEAEQEARENADTALQEEISNFGKVLDFANMPAFYYPQHIGDFINAEKAGGVCRNGDNFYFFSSNEWDGLGTITICDTATNTFSELKNKRVGHANSCANDTARGRVWVCPLNQPDKVHGADNPPIPLNLLYWYNYQFTQANTVNLDFQPQGVSFDSVTNTVWVCSTTQNNEYRLYKMEEGESEFAYYGALPTHFVHPSRQATFQDFAVHNNMGFFVDTVMNAAIVDMVNLETVKMGVIGNQSAQWRYGEPQGVEFDENGNLYQARYAPFGFTPTGAYFPLSMNSVTALLTTPNGGVSEVIPFTAARTMTISEETQRAFTNERYQIKSANVLPWLVMPNCTVIYQGNVVEPETLYIDNPTDLALVVSAGADVSIPDIQINRNKLLLLVEDAKDSVPIKGICRFTKPANCVRASGNRPASFCFANLGKVYLPQGRSNIAQFGTNVGAIYYWYAGELLYPDETPVGAPSFNSRVCEDSRMLIVGTNGIKLPALPQ